MLNWALRYAPIVAAVRASRPGRVLEVGSGSRGLAHYVPELSVTGVDVHFDGPPTRNLTPIEASVSDLPLADHSFDFVVSSDMMEHVAPSVRARAVAEMWRVCRGHLAIGFPSGIRAQSADRAIGRLLEQRGMPIPPWLLEHFEHPFPTSKDILLALPPGAHSTRVLPNENLLVHRAVILAELRSRKSHPLGRIDRLRLVTALGSVLNLDPTYREIVFVDRAP